MDETYETYTRATLRNDLREIREKINRFLANDVDDPTVDNQFRWEELEDENGPYQTETRILSQMMERVRSRVTMSARRLMLVDYLKTNVDVAMTRIRDSQVDDADAEGEGKVDDASTDATIEDRRASPFEREQRELCARICNISMPAKLRPELSSDQWTKTNIIRSPHSDAPYEWWAARMERVVRNREWVVGWMSEEEAQRELTRIRDAVVSPPTVIKDEHGDTAIKVEPKASPRN